MTYAGWTATPGCERAWSDLPRHRAACGLICEGTWYETIRYRVQSRSSKESPFVNVNGAECLSALSFTVSGLATGQEYGFRVFASGLNEEGPDMRGGNILYQRPMEVPQSPAQISLVSTYRTGEAAKVGRATLPWSDIDTPATVKSITAYKVQISPDGKAFFNSLI